MRALLVNPWIYDFKAFDFWNKPLGIMTVSSILKRFGFAVDYIDCLDRRSPYFKTPTRTDGYGRGKYLSEAIEKPELFKKIPRRYKRYGMPMPAFLEALRRVPEPDLIFVASSMTYWYPGVFEAIRILKRRFPKARIVLGGIYATLCEKHARENSGADLVLPGPAEANLVSFLKTEGYGETAPEAGGTAPDFDLYPELDYGVVLPSKGCPFSCTYCATYFLSPGYETQDWRAIDSQLRYFKGRTANIAFFDDALLCNRDLPAILGSAIANGYGFRLHGSNGLHCRYIAPEIARLMHQAGFQTAYLSLETTDPDLQRATGGKVFTDEFVRSVKVLAEAGFTRGQLHAYLLFGLPGQPAGLIRDAIEFCRRTGVNPHLCEFSPIPHTAEYEKTGLGAGADPLAHNNYYYTWHVAHPDPARYREMKSWLREAGTKGGI